MSKDKIKSGHDENGYPWAESADGRIRVHVNVHDDPGHGKSFILVGDIVEDRDDGFRNHYLWPLDEGGVCRAVRKMPSLGEASKFCRAIELAQVKPYPAWEPVKQPCEAA